MKAWLIISIILSVFLVLLLRHAKGHQTDGDMGLALITMAFLFAVILDWAALVFVAVYRYLNGGGA